MEYYSDICVPTDHVWTDPYNTEYTAQYLAPSHESEYTAQYLAPSHESEYTAQYLIPSHESEYSCRSSVLVDGGDRFAVSAVTFDKLEELIWMGNQGGHVTSYYGPNMQKYTSFQVHESEEVRDIITADAGIYTLTKTMLRHHIRRGIPKHTFRSPHMSDMQCLYQESSTKLLMGGHQNKLIELDLTTMAERIFSIQEEGCAVLRSGGGSLVACGSANGTVALRDVRTPGDAEHMFQAHTACLSDLDMQGDLLITCGFTDGEQGAVAEPYIIVWDVRYLRGTKTMGASAWSLPTASPPLLLHFVPAFSGKALAASGDGHVALLNVHNTEQEQSVFQVDTNSSICSVMDVATSSQAFAFGDHSGHLHLFAPRHNHEPVFNNFSRATEFAAPPPTAPFVSITDPTFQFSSVKLPPLNGNRWFNELPPEFYRTTHRKPKPIDPEVLRTMKMQGPIGYAPNPKTCRRNQMPYIEDTFEDLIVAKQNDNYVSSQPIPKQYQKTDVRYNKQGMIDLDDLANYNKTGHPGLEATIPNSYCNAMLQVLYNTPAVKATLLAHTCAKEFCLSCELGFLFRMLDASNGAPCQAGNFLRAFRTIPEAAALGLILPDRGPDPRLDLVALIQSWNRFILHQIHSEIVETRRKEKELAVLSSPPNRPGNMQLPNNLATQPMNGYHGEDYQYSEIEFLPSTQFGGVREGELGEERSEVWPTHFGIGQDPEVNVFQPGDRDTLAQNHTEGEESEISQLFAIGRHQLNRCLKCNKEEERETVVLACALQYPTGSRDGDVKGGFVELLGASLAGGRSTPAWCEQCARFTPTTQRGRIVRLPPILAINCGGVTAHEKAYWAKSMQKDMVDSRRGSSSKPCRYGLHCARPGCRFKHPDRPGSSQSNSSSSRSSTHESLCVLPLQLDIRLQPDGDVVIYDKSDLSPIESPKHEPAKLKNGFESQEEYTLSAAVICVEDDPQHLVAYVQPSGLGVHGEWYLVNDLSIIQVPPQEVVHFNAWWKSPCVLFYSNESARPLMMS